MKSINSINIDDAPLGMLIKNHKNNKYYVVNLDKLNRKCWKLCTCDVCSSKKNKLNANSLVFKGGFSNIYNSSGSNTKLAPNPQEHSWHHHHAPFYQVFNNYVCIKKDTLGEISNFFIEMFKKS